MRWGTAIGMPNRTVTLSVLLFSKIVHLYLSARLEILSFCQNALVIIDVVLPAVFSPDSSRQSSFPCLKLPRRHTGLYLEIERRSQLFRLLISVLDLFLLCRD